MNVYVCIYVGKFFSVIIFIFFTHRNRIVYARLNCALNRYISYIHIFVLYLDIHMYMCMYK